MTQNGTEAGATTTDFFDALHPVPAAQHPELLGPPVIAALEHVPEALVFEIDPNLSDTDVMCEALGLPLDVMGNAVLVAGRRAGSERSCCCMTLGDRRVDVNGCVRHRLDVRKASFAPLEEATSTTGMEYGGITPVGLGEQWPVWLDETIRDVEWLCIGSGVRRSKLILHGRSLLDLPGAQLVEGLTR